MRRRLRLVRKLHKKELAVLRDRLRAFRERPKIALLLVILLLPSLAAPLIGALRHVTTPYILPCLILLTAQIAGLLRNPFRPRKAVRHPLPLWFFWLTQLVCGVGATVLIITLLSLKWEGYSIADWVYNYLLVAAF